MTKIGILLCDDHYPESVEKFGTYDQAFMRIFPSLGAGQFRSWRCHLGQFPDGLDKYDAWLVSGSKWSVYENLPWINQLADTIQAIDRNKQLLLGVCFGHQMIHHALGGSVIRSSKGWGLGLYANTVKTDYKTLRKGETLELIAMHQDQVEDPASGFETIASSAFCQYAITSKDSHVLTLQAHPEFSGEFFVQLCERIKDSAGEQKVTHAIEEIRYKGEGDRERVNGILQSFICQDRIEKSSCYPNSRLR